MSANDVYDLCGHPINSQTDEKLIARYHATKQRELRDAIVLRYWEQVGRWIAHWGRVHGIPEEKVHDLQGDCCLWIIDRINTFDPEQRGALTYYHFNTYLRQRVDSRLTDHLRFRQREQRYFPAAFYPLEAILEGSTTFTYDPAGCRSLQAIGVADPGDNAQRHEEQQLLSQGIAALGPEDSKLYKLRVAGSTVHEMGQGHNLSRSTVRRRLLELDERLCSRWRNCT